MTEFYDFTDLIERHSVPFEVLSYGDGSYVGGKWQSGSESVSEANGAILPLAERKIYHSGGTYTTQDRNLYMNSPIEGALKELKVRYQGNIYSVEEETDYPPYSGTYIYVLKWVSAVD